MSTHLPDDQPRAYDAGVGLPDGAGYIIVSDADGKWLDVLTAAGFLAANTAALPVYLDDATAGAGGLTTGQFYQTATGEVRIKL